MPKGGARRALSVAFLLLTLLVAAGCGDDGSNVPDPPSFNGTSNESSYRIIRTQRMTVKGVGTSRSTIEIEYEAPGRYSYETSGDAFLGHAIIIGEEAWRSRQGLWESVDPNEVEYRFAGLASMEAWLATGEFKPSGSGPTRDGEQTQRYRKHLGKETFDRIIKTQSEILSSPNRDFPPFDATEIAQVNKPFRGATGEIEVLVGRRTGRIYYIRQETKSLYGTSLIEDTFSDFGDHFNITPPSGLPTPR